MFKPVKKPYRILFWATTFQSDIHSFVRYLDAHPDYEIRIALDHPEGFQKEGVQQLLPIKAQMLDKQKKETLLKLKLFRPHALVTDNHFPPLRFGKKLLVLWHGFGWRMDNLSGEFEHVHNNIRRLVGDGKAPNPNFIWQCYGTEDLKYRHRVSGFARENLRIFGSAQADDILNVKIDKKEAAPFYSVDIVNRPNILLGFTWHHGRLLSHWGDDPELFKELFAFGEDIGVNFIVRMHDSFRYDPSYLKELDELIKGYDHVMFKFKDTSQDNLIDILISDVMVSNYSSLINRFYITGRPSIHIFPVRKGEERFVWRRLGGNGKLVEENVHEEFHGWKFPPEMIGGLMVNTMEEFKEAIIRSLREPDCCREKSRKFVEEHMGGADGHICERIEKELRALIER